MPRWLESMYRLQPFQLIYLRTTTMAKNSRQTSSKAATAASKVLRNPSSTKAEKTAAASALSQKGKGK